MNIFRKLIELPEYIELYFCQWVITQNRITLVILNFILCSINNKQYLPKLTKFGKKYLSNFALTQEIMVLASSPSYYCKHPALKL